jgi:predicted nucleic acid-binding protein
MAPSRPLVFPALVAWLERHTAYLYLSVMTVAEIEEGIAKSRREHARRKADDLQAWLSSVLRLYGNRVLPVDEKTARAVGSLSDLARSLGRPPGLADIIVAATAQQHGLTILTRNLRHFQPLGVPTHDPFANLPPQ